CDAISACRRSSRAGSTGTTGNPSVATGRRGSSPARPLRHHSRDRKREHSGREMTSSIDWTLPEAYSGRIVRTPRKRSLGAIAVLRTRIFIRAQWQERQRMRKHEDLVRIGRYLPDNVRKDIGLPPYHP